MISICIPVFNYNVVKLVNTLASQIKRLSVPVELIVIDDCSSLIFKEENKSISQNVVFIELGENVGRAVIRNKFLEFATYEYLLFLDCDSLIIQDDFLNNYVNVIKQEQPNVVCGGRKYPESCPNKDWVLRWKYGVRREYKSVRERAENPNQSFMTNNFLVKRDVLNEVRFNESLREYGHEDTLFGYELKRKGILIQHIDNEILNGDFESNKSYLLNTENAIHNLVHIYKLTGNDLLFVNEVALLRYFFKVKKIRSLVNLLFIVFGPFIKILLSKGYVNIKMFDFYKLGFLSYEIGDRLSNEYN